MHIIHLVNSIKDEAHILLQESTEESKDLQDTLYEFGKPVDYKSNTIDLDTAVRQIEGAASSLMAIKKLTEIQLQKMDKEF